MCDYEYEEVVWSEITDQEVRQMWLDRRTNGMLAPFVFVILGAIAAFVSAIWLSQYLVAVVSLGTAVGTLLAGGAKEIGLYFKAGFMSRDQLIEQLKNLMMDD